MEIRGVTPRPARHADSTHPLNLFRMHWYNTADRKGLETVPGHIILPESLTGVKAPIVLLLGERFPMITAHKVAVLSMVSVLCQPTCRLRVLPAATSCQRTAASQPASSLPLARSLKSGDSSSLT